MKSLILGICLVIGMELQAATPTPPIRPNLFSTNTGTANVAGVLTNTGAASGGLSFVPLSTLISNVNLSVVNVTNINVASNLFVTNNISVNSNLFVSNSIFTTNITASFVTNFNLTVNSNVTFKGNSTFNTVVITNGPYAPTNKFTGPTNNYDLALRKQYYVTFTPMSITNFNSKSNGIAMQSTLVISNGATTNITLLIPNTVGEPTRASSFTVSNASKAFIWFDYADDTGTNAVFRQF